MRRRGASAPPGMAAGSWPAPRLGCVVLAFERQASLGAGDVAITKTSSRHAWRTTAVPRDPHGDAIKRLQGCITDRLSVLALPALWSGRASSQMADTLLDVLVRLLCLDVADVRLRDAMDGAPIEVVRLHDVTAQDLGAVVVNLAHLRRVVTDLTPEAQTFVTERVALAEDVLQHIRTRSSLLHPPLLDYLELAAALHWYIEGFTKRSGIHVNLGIAPEIARLSPDIETALFRIVQESLTNIHRHSGSASARITLVKEGQGVGLHVKDQGAGMLDEASGATLDSLQRLGVGILGMRQRVRQFGGTLEIQTGRQGTEIIATVPVGGR
jgi:signal transduction histidine kinase